MHKITPDQILIFVLSVIGAIIILGLIVSYVKKPKKKNIESTNAEYEVYLPTKEFVLKGRMYPKGEDENSFYIIKGSVESQDSLYPDVKWIKFRVQKDAMRLRIIWNTQKAFYELVDLRDCHYPAIGFDMD